MLNERMHAGRTHTFYPGKFVELFARSVTNWEVYLHGMTSFLSTLIGLQWYSLSKLDLVLPEQPKEPKIGQTTRNARVFSDLASILKGARFVGMPAHCGDNMKNLKSQNDQCAQKVWIHNTHFCVYSILQLI